MMTKRMLLALGTAMLLAACGGTEGGDAPSAEGGAKADSAQSDNTSQNGAHTGG
jgi:ABC-type glycerol-3-phosphate transport system substrate-binding protein